MRFLYNRWYLIFLHLLAPCKRNHNFHLAIEIKIVRHTTDNQNLNRNQVVSCPRRTHVQHLAIQIMTLEYIQIYNCTTLCWLILLFIWANLTNLQSFNPNRVWNIGDDIILLHLLQNKVAEKFGRKLRKCVKSIIILSIYINLTNLRVIQSKLRLVILKMILCRFIFCKRRKSYWIVCEKICKMCKIGSFWA